MDIEHVSVVVTGAASGLGAATAAKLADHGCHVFGLDVASTIDTAEPTDGITLIPTDVTDPAAVHAAIAQAASGARPLRIAVNCAGIAPSARTLGRSGPHDLDLFRRVIDINLIGTFIVLSIAAEAIAKTSPDDDGQRGVIINTASIAAYEGQIGQAAYAASKAGVIGLTLTAQSREFVRGEPGRVLREHRGEADRRHRRRADVDQRNASQSSMVGRPTPR